MGLRAAAVHENYNLYLNLLCRLTRLGHLSQWPVVNKLAQLTQRTQRAQLFKFIQFRVFASAGYRPLYGCLILEIGFWFGNGS